MKPIEDFPFSFLSLKYVLCLAKERNFTYAAKKLLISQPALSQQIAHIEEQCGMLIFDRSSKPIELTPFGKIMIKKIEIIFKQIENFKNEMDYLRAKKFEKVIIGLSPVRSYYTLPKLLTELSDQYPNATFICLEAASDELEIMLDNDLLDIAILPTPIKNSKLSTDHLYIERISLFAPKTFKLKKNTSLIDLFGSGSSYSLILTHSHTRFRGFIDDALNFFKIEPKVTIEVGDFLTAMNLVKKGLGIAFAPTVIFNKHEHAKWIIPYHLDEQIFKREIVIAYKTNKRLTQLPPNLLLTIRDVFAN